MAILAIGSDHTGYKLKREIYDYFTNRGYQVIDLGCDSPEYVDFPDYADKVAETVASDSECLGVLICGTGIGMSIAANRRKGVRAALCHTEYEAQLSRDQHNANVLCIGARTFERDAALRVVGRFLRSEYSDNRYEQCLQKVDRLAS